MLSDLDYSSTPSTSECRFAACLNHSPTSSPQVSDDLLLALITHQHHYHKWWLVACLDHSPTTSPQVSDGLLFVWTTHKQLHHQHHYHKWAMACCLFRSLTNIFTTSERWLVACFDHSPTSSPQVSDDLLLAQSPAPTTLVSYWTNEQKWIWIKTRGFCIVQCVKWEEILCSTPTISLYYTSPLTNLTP